DHHQLVDEREPLDQPRADRPDDTADRGLFVERRQSDRDAQVLALLRVDQTAKVGELRRAERVLGEPLVHDLAEHAASLAAVLRQPRALGEYGRGDRRARPDDERVARVVEERVPDRAERILDALAPGRAKDDRVVLRELFLDDLHRLARPRDEALDALVVGAFAEQLIKGRTPAAALARASRARRRVRASGCADARVSSPVTSITDASTTSPSQASAVAVSRSACSRSASVMATRTFMRPPQARAGPPARRGRGATPGRAPATGTARADDRGRAAPCRRSPRLTNPVPRTRPHRRPGRAAWVGRS